MYTITAPVKGYSGEGYGLKFLDGTAQTDNKHVAGLLAEKGYVVEGLPDVSGTSFTKGWKKADLQAYLKEHGVAFDETANNATLAELCQKTHAAEAGNGGDGE